MTNQLNVKNVSNMVIRHLYAKKESQLPVKYACKTMQLKNIHVNFKTTPQAQPLNTLLLHVRHAKGYTKYSIGIVPRANKRFDEQKLNEMP
jgi:hypothetical protein